MHKSRVKPYVFDKHVMFHEQRQRCQLRNEYELMLKKQTEKELNPEGESEPNIFLSANSDGNNMPSKADEYNHVKLSTELR